jgi:large subunit ribosomal protein L15
MRDLSNLKPNKGANRKPKRIGRGIASGWGKTAAKGHKGQKARKGGGIAPGFEGGQTPLYRRLPKRGFTPHSRNRFNIVNVSQLAVFKEGDRVDSKLFLGSGLLRKPGLPVKLLGNGSLDKKLTVVVSKASAGAVEIIKKAGGSVEIKGS